MRTTLRLLTTLVGTVLGAGVLSPIISANWQEWAKASGQDQYLVKYAGPVMDNLASIAQSGWFVFAAGFFIGGATFLWVDYFLRSRHPAPPIRIAGQELSYGLHVKTMMVGYAKPHKRLQIGFILANASDGPLRYEVEQIWAIADQKTNENPHVTNKGSIVAKGSTSTYSFAAIIVAIPKKGIEGRASITYKYGSAELGAPFVRRANYEVLLSIGPDGTAIHNIMRQSDEPI